jgi:hypothetical protein
VLTWHAWSGRSSRHCSASTAHRRCRRRRPQREHHRRRHRPCALRTQSCQRCAPPARKCAVLRLRPLNVSLNVFLMCAGEARAGDCDDNGGASRAG